MSNLIQTRRNARQVAAEAGINDTSALVLAAVAGGANTKSAVETAINGEGDEAVTVVSAQTIYNTIKSLVDQGFMKRGYEGNTSVVLLTKKGSKVGEALNA